MPKESPKVLFSATQDFVPQATPEATVPFFVIFNSRGPVEDILVDLEGFETLFGKPDVFNYGISALYPYLFLQRTGGVCYVRRALHTEDVNTENLAKYSGALSRWIKDGVTDRAMSPIVDGIVVGGFEKYNFPTSQDTRKIYSASSALIFKATENEKDFFVRDIDNLLLNAKQISVLGANELPNDETVVYNVNSVTPVNDVYNYVKFTTPIGARALAGSLVREVVRDYFDGFILKSDVTVVPQIIQGKEIIVNNSIAFNKGDVVRFAFGKTIDTAEYTVKSVTSNSIKIDRDDLNGFVVADDTVIFTEAQSTTTSDIRIVPTDGTFRVIPRESVTDINTFDVLAKADIQVNDLLFLTANDAINGNSNIVTDVQPSSVSGYNTITVTDNVTLAGEDNIEKAFDIFKQVAGFNGMLLRPLISPETGTNVKVRETAEATTADVLVDDNDVLNQDMYILIDDGSAPNGVYSGDYLTVNYEYNVDNSFTKITVDKDIKTLLTSKIYVKLNSDLKEKDALLWVALTPGKYGDNISVNIADSDQSTDYFEVTVMYKGEQVEGPFVCTRQKEAVDAFGQSLFVEDVINGKSTFIWVVDNPDAVHPETREPYRPLNTDYMILRPAPEPSYEDMRAKLNERVYSGDSVLKVRAQTSADLVKWSVADNIALKRVNGSYDIYQVNSVEIDPVTPTIANITIVGTAKENHPYDTVIDRMTGYTQGEDILVQGNDTTLDIGSPYSFGGVNYTVIDAGANWFKKGSDGLLHQEHDVLRALADFGNIDKFPEELLLSDSGIATASSFSNLAQIAKDRERCMFYGSVPKQSSTLTQGQYVQNCVDYAESTMTTDKYSRIFSGYSKVSYGANSFWVNDHLFTIINQYENTLIREGVLPAANNRGKITGIIEKDITLDIPFQDRLEAAQINYARKVGVGYVCMSNNTRFNIDSFFQFAHIIHYVNAVHSIVNDVFHPYLQTVVTENDVENVDTSIGNLLTRQLDKMTESYETSSKFLSQGNGTTIWKYKLAVKPRDITTKIIFDLTVTHKNLEIKVSQG